MKSPVQLLAEKLAAKTERFHPPFTSPKAPFQGSHRYYTISFLLFLKKMGHITLQRRKKYRGK